MVWHAGCPPEYGNHLNKMEKKIGKKMEKKIEKKIENRIETFKALDGLRIPDAGFAWIFRVNGATEDDEEEEVPLPRKKEEDKRR